MTRDFKAPERDAESWRGGLHDPIVALIPAT